MNWIVASLVSALFLGVYDLCIKHAIRDNAVLPVLFFSTLTGAAVWAALLLVQMAHPGLLPASLVTEPLTLEQHLQLLLKSAIVTASWIFTYFGINHLPLSLASPIRATTPLWTLFGALLILGEHPTGLELAGIVTTLAAFFGLSLAGRLEGVHFHRDKWVGFLLAGTVLGGVSALYDKYLLGRAHFNVPTVQAWFSIYLVALFTPFAVGWQRRWWERNEFYWRWTIPVIALSLLVADYIYFWALRQPGSLVSVVMSLRRGNTLVAFAGGLLLFGERSNWQKILAAIGIVAGIVITVMG
jgi:drug/metabolite transporter (DMT)-like permease